MSEILNNANTLDDLNMAIAHARANGFRLDHIDDESVVFARSLNGLKCADELEYALQRCAGRNYMEVKDGYCGECVFIVRFKLDKLEGEWCLYDKNNYAVLYKDGVFDESVYPIVDSYDYGSTALKMAGSIDETVVESANIETIGKAILIAVDDLDYYAHDCYTCDFSESAVSGHEGYGAYCPRHDIFPSRFNEYPSELELKKWLRFTAFDPYSEESAKLIKKSNLTLSVVDWEEDGCPRTVVQKNQNASPVEVTEEVVSDTEEDAYSDDMPY